MSQPERHFKEGERVWHRGRPATFLYYVREGAVAIRFDGRRDSTVVSTTGLSADPTGAQH
jgi:hypothetical protein